MQDAKPAFSSKTIIGIIVGAVPTVVVGLKFFGVDIADLASDLTTGLIALVGLIGTIIAIVGRFKARQPLTLSATGKTVSCVPAFLIVLCLGFTSCSTIGGFGGTITPDEVTALTTVAVSNGLQFGVSDPGQRAAVAKEMTSVADIYVTYSNGKVPDPVQFQALLNTYLPAGSSKAITVTDLTALYTVRYATFKDLQLPTQIEYLTAFLNGVKAGATPFAGTASP